MAILAGLPSPLLPLQILWVNLVTDILPAMALIRDPAELERVHAGVYRGYPLELRRVTPTEERALMDFASERLALGMTVCLQLTREHPRRPWAEQVLPYGVAEWWWITPSRWTLTEASREVRLPAV